MTINFHQITSDGVNKTLDRWADDTNPLKLRPYQEDAVKQTIEWFKVKDSVYGQAATGAGKTVIAVAMCRLLLERNPDAFILFISHKEDLVTQPIEKLEEFIPEFAPFGLLYGKKHRLEGVNNHGDFVKCRIVSATFQTLSGKNFRWLRQLVALYGRIDLVIEDECHHSVSEKRIEIHQHLRSALGAYKIMGLSATPYRNDGKEMSDLFEGCSFKIPIAKLIGMGWLCDFDFPHYIKLPDADFAKVTSSGTGEARDYSEEKMATILDAKNVIEIIAEKWYELARTRKTMTFVPRTEMAMHLCEHINREYPDITTGVVSGYKEFTGVYDRHGVFTRVARTTLVKKMYQYGNVNMLINCMVLTEGTDIPVTSCVVIARPTRNKALITQIIGRALRLPREDSPKPEIAQILTVVPLNCLKQLTGAELKKEIEEEAAEAENIFFIEEEDDFVFDAGMDVDPSEIIVKRIPWLRKSEYAWFSKRVMAVVGLGALKTRDGICRVGIAVVTNSKKAKKALKLKKHKAMIGNYTEFFSATTAIHLVILFHYYGDTGKGTAKAIGLYDDQKNAIRRAERYADGLLDGNEGIDSIKKNAQWRRSPQVSDSMRQKLAKWDMPIDNNQSHPTDWGSRTIYYQSAATLLGLR